MNQHHTLKEITEEDRGCFCCGISYTSICSCGYKSIGSDKEFVIEEHKEHVKEVGRSITGGTWSATPYGRVMSGRVFVAEGCSTSDAKLIALAPEMAEAILAFDAKWWGEVMQPAMDYLHEIAEKLREIKGGA